MNVISRTLAIAAFFVRPSLRQPMLIVLVTLLPISFVIIFHLIGGRELGTHALLGMLVVFVINAGIVALPQMAVSFRVSQLQEMFVASPIGPGMFASGMGLSRLIFAAPALVIVLAILLFRHIFTAADLPAVVLVLLISWFTGVMIGFTISVLVPNIYQISIVANFAGMVISVLPPVYYPLDLLPGYWKWVAFVVPTTHATQLLRVFAGMAKTSSTLLAVHWTLLILCGVVCGGLVIRRMQWREE